MIGNTQQAATAPTPTPPPTHPEIVGRLGRGIREARRRWHEAGSNEDLVAVVIDPHFDRGAELLGQLGISGLDEDTVLLIERDVLAEADWAMAYAILRPTPDWGYPQLTVLPDMVCHGFFSRSAA